MVLLTAVLGAASGASRQLANAVALVIAFLCARPLGKAIAAPLAQALGGPLLFGTVAGTLLAFILALVIFRLVLSQLFRVWMVGRDSQRKGFDRWAGFLVGAVKALAIAYVMVSGLVFVEDNVTLAGQHLGISPKDSVAFGLARRFNVFEYTQFHAAKDLLTVAQLQKDPASAERLASDPSFRALRQDARFRQAMSGRPMRHALETGDYRELLRNNAVLQLVQDRQAAARLSAAARAAR